MKNLDAFTQSWSQLSRRLRCHLSSDRGIKGYQLDARMHGRSEAISWSIGSDRFEEFAALGLNRRNFFPHILRFLRRPGPDGAKLARRMYGLTRFQDSFELVLHAHPDACGEFHPDLFFDREIVWHQQHLGLPGHIAVADLILQGKTLYTTARFSDVVQRIARRRDLKTRVERVFRGWDQMLLNGIIHFAVQYGVEEIYFPSPELALTNTDRSRNPGPMLFDRLYGTHLQPLQPRRVGPFWVVKISDACRRLVAPVRCIDTLELRNSICIVHDTERGLGYRAVDAAFAARADRESPAALDRMLAIEAKLGVKSTYSVVGSFLDEVREKIESHGHALAFHSFDHTMKGDQLGACRRVDYRLPGFRPPQSRLTRSLADHQLVFQNFEWLASSQYSLGFANPSVVHGLVKIPIAMDDHVLHTRQITYPEWVQNLERWATASPFLAFGLHDCYAQEWVGSYEELLTSLKDLGNLQTLDHVANTLNLCTAV